VKFPRLYDGQLAARRRLDSLLGRPHEEDFRGLGQFDLGRGLALDVGANLGQSAESIRLFQAEMELVSFEPNPLFSDRLLSLTERLGNARYQPFGLAEAASDEVLHLPRVRGYLFHQLGSFRPIDPSEIAAYLSERFFVRKVAASEVSTEQYPSKLVTLDSLGLKPAFIKIDTEGTAPSVLKGGMATIRAHRPLMLIEASESAEAKEGKLEGPDAQSLLHMLDGLGYRMYRYQDGRFIPDRAGTLNTWFITDELASHARLPR
jgi:FkbM family methyltransferase